MKRSYSYLMTRPGGYMFWPAKYITSNARIRVIALVMFRKFFGHNGKLIWHQDGFMAEAKDKRGNAIQVFQANHDPKLKEAA